MRGCFGLVPPIGCNHRPGARPADGELQESARLPQPRSPVRGCWPASPPWRLVAFGPSDRPSYIHYETRERLVLATRPLLSDTLAASGVPGTADTDRADSWCERLSLVWEVWRLGYTCARFVG